MERPTRLCKSLFCSFFYVFYLQYHIFFYSAKFVFVCGTVTCSDGFGFKYILISSQMIELNVLFIPGWWLRITLVHSVWLNFYYHFSQTALFLPGSWTLHHLRIDLVIGSWLCMSNICQWIVSGDFGLYHNYLHF